MSKYNQFRGHCQCCGREQAVPAGLMSKHGYTVENGWFNGVCSGQMYQPIEKDITQANKIIAQITGDIRNLARQLDSFETGKLFPDKVTRGSFRNKIEIPFNEANEWEKKQAIAKAIWDIKSRIRMGENFIEDLTSIIKQFHGKPLIEVARKEAPEAIVQGEKRVSAKGEVLTCLYVKGARVYWKSERIKTAWTGSTSWRKLEKEKI